MDGIKLWRIASFNALFSAGQERAPRSNLVCAAWASGTHWQRPISTSRAGRDAHKRWAMVTWGEAVLSSPIGLPLAIVKGQGRCGIADL
jgi:hypothetical protein